VTIDASTSIDPIRNSSTAMPSCPKRPSAQRAATAAMAMNSTKPSAGKSAIGLPGGVGASDRSARRYSHHPAPQATTNAGATTSRNGNSNRLARIATSRITRRYITALARAMPAGSAPPPCPLPSRWASDWVTAVEL
jgi:hypothetical protein